ncbi:beta-N-acetylhexosaminidase [Streptacidiphilus sp. PAMC 29251]
MVHRGVVRAVGTVVGVLALVTACSSGGAASRPSASGGSSGSSGSAKATAAAAPLGLVPLPLQLQQTGGAGYPVTASTAVHGEGGAAATTVAADLAALLRPSTGFALPVEGAGSANGIELKLDPAAGTGAEGYRLESGPTGVVITAGTGAGLYHGAQTLRQLLPPKGPGTVPAVSITDQPRYGYRSGGLDVSRHFFPVSAVEHYIDLLAQYKFNYLRLHLSDDQGWRIAVPGLPKLTGIGASTQVGGGEGGFYTDADYKQLVAYAAARFITVVPEVDLPGHSNAALSAYPSLGCAGDAPVQPYSGTDVGFSRVCTTKESTYTFVDQVVSALAAMTPGPYVGIGGDEAQSLSAPDYAAFMARASAIVRKHGKQPLAWDEAAAAGKGGPALLGVWHPLSQQPAGLNDQLVAAAEGGAKLVMEPADQAYLDQKYDPATALGLHWAGYLPVQRTYDWNPDTYLSGLPAGAVTGVEAPIWTETLANEQDLDTMLLPRLPALAEVAWTPQADRHWDAFQQRLADQALYWTAQGLTWTRAAGVDWPK